MSSFTLDMFLYIEYAKGSKILRINKCTIAKLLDNSKNQKHVYFCVITNQLEKDISNTIRAVTRTSRGTWLAQSVDCGTVDLGVVSSIRTLGVEILKNKKSF